MVILVMGVAGSGKSTIAHKLADSLGWQYIDADDFHPLENIEKMRQGMPLTDRDRLPWLSLLQHMIETWLKSQQNVVLACSALKAAYRQMLHVGQTGVQLVYLKGSDELLAERIQQRHNHFMKLELLKSQLDVLEEPTTGIVIEISQTPEAIVQQIRQALNV